MAQEWFQEWPRSGTRTDFNYKMELDIVFIVIPDFISESEKPPITPYNRRRCLENGWPHPHLYTSGKYCHTSHRLRRRGVEGKQGKNRSPMVLLIILLCLAHNGFRPIMSYSEAGKWRLVEAACEYLYRLRPLVEWTAYRASGKQQHKAPKQFLLNAWPRLTISARRGRISCIRAEC